ncbi:MAG: MlaD family protein [Methylomonas sp.]|nr:MlaD family protein [Methylomonas sp.]
MSKPVNPTVIGGFTLGALALLVIAMLVFGGGKELNADKIKYVVFFDSSLNGLEIGAPVKLQGVKIGQVTEISLQLDAKRGKLFKPVELEIDRSSISDFGGGDLPQKLSFEQLKESRDRLVKLGMRARLETQSLLTGLLYVDLNFYPDRPPVFTGLVHDQLLEIPGVPTTADEIKTTAEEVAKKLRAMPLDQIVQDFSDNLREIKTLLASEDVERSRVALANTLEELDKTTKTLNRHLEPLLKNTDMTIVNTNHLMQETHAMVQELKQDLPAILKSSDKTLNAASSALVKAEESLRHVDEAVGPESALTDALDAVKQAARAIRNLGDYLERHPEAVLSGKER